MILAICGLSPSAQGGCTAAASVMRLSGLPGYPGVRVGRSRVRAMSKSARLLLRGQLLLAVSLLLCTALLPQFFFSWNQGGVSNYGVNGRTMVPFSVGFIGCAVMMVLAAFALPDDGTTQTRYLRLAIAANAVLPLLVTLTTYTYKVNSSLNALHVHSSRALTLAEAPLVLWLALRVIPGRAAKWLLAVFCCGFAIGVLTLAGIVHFLNLAELLTVFSAGALLVLHDRRHQWRAQGGQLDDAPARGSSDG